MSDQSRDRAQLRPRRPRPPPPSEGAHPGRSGGARGPQPARPIAYEKGSRTPGPTILHRLAEALGVDVLKLTSATLRTATLTDLRARAGFTKTELAAELGLRRHTYDRIERGVREAEPELVPRLAAALGVSGRTLAGALRRSRSPRR